MTHELDDIEAEALAEIEVKLQDKWWRLDNLYMIENERGELVRFRLRPAQSCCFRRCGS